MKIQGILDLSGFELQNFCIQNYTDKANVANLGRGRKFFFTGNSTDQDYHRELIYDGSSWRATAYLDDIDKVNEKLDLIFGDELDTDTIIDSWKEVQDFLSGIEDTKTLMTMLDGKAEWNRSISSDSFKAIGYGNIGTDGWKFNGPALSFGANSTYYAQLQINFQADQVVFRRHTTEGFTEWRTLLHEGNVGEYTAGAANHLNSTEVSGEGSDSILDDIFTKKSGISVNIARNLGSGSLFVSRDTIVVNYSWGGRYGQQWAIEDTSHKILVRTKNADQTGAAWSDWKTIAFTDSNITGNAATATALKNKVSLWDNEFDGTQSLNGNLSLESSRIFWAKNSNAYYIGVSYALSGGAPNLDYSGFSGHRFLIRSNVSAMTINSEGNVTIGNGDYAGTDYKFRVQGNGFFNGDLHFVNWAFLRSFDTSGNVHTLIGLNNYNQVLINSGTDVPTIIRGGNVLIGPADDNGAKLQVNGTSSFSNLATFNGGALIPTGQKLTIGSVTIEYDSNAKAIKVDGNLFTTGTNASGGVADAQQGGTGGNAEVYKYDLDWGEQVYEIQNVKGDVNVNVQVYEWNENGNSWDMILTDVSVTANIITVTFGSPTSVDHMVTVV